MRAETRAGELLAEMATHKQRHAGKGQPREVLRSRDATVSVPKLSDLGVTKTQSSRWRKPGRVPTSRTEGFSMPRCVGMWEYVSFVYNGLTGAWAFMGGAWVELEPIVVDDVARSG